MKPVKNADQTDECDYNRKMIIIGDSGVGKSSLLIRYTNGSFVENYMMTIGISHCWKILEIDGLKLKLQIWDTAGQEKYKTITKNYYRNSHGAIIAFSINSYDSFMSVRNWIDDLTFQIKEDISILLVGTKKDLKEERVIEFDEANDFANKNGMSYLECSAKNNESVDEVFMTMARMIKAKSIDERLKKGEQMEKEQSLKIGKTGKKMRKNCCKSD